VETRTNLTKAQTEVRESLLVISQINSRTTDLLRELQQIDVFIQSAEDEISRIEGRIHEKEALIRRIEIQKDADRARLAGAGALFEHSLDASGRGVSFWEEVLTSKSPLQMNLRLEKLLSVYDLYVASLSEGEGDSAEREELLLEKQRLEEDRSRAVYKQSFIERNRAEKTRILEGLNGQKDIHLANIKHMEQVSRDLTQAISRLQRTGNALSTRPGRGVLSWPAAGGRITSGFGNRRLNGLQEFHQGIDIGGLPHGTPVLASAAGTVIHAGWLSGYGKTIILDHGNGISTLYAHNSHLVVRDGQAVRQGQQVARLGSTGFSTGPHIHFEVRINGEPVNPMDWL